MCEDPHTLGAPDAVVGLDGLLHDQERPGELRPNLDSGDHLHPDETNYVETENA